MFYSSRMSNAQTLKKRLDMILSREKTKRKTSSAKSRNLGMPKSFPNERQIRTSHHPNNNSVSRFGSYKNECNSMNMEPKWRERTTSRSCYQSKQDLNSSGNLFMFKKSSLSSHEDSLNFARLNVADSLHVSALKEEDHRGRIILTSRESFIQEEHFLPGLKFTGVNLRLNSSAINNLKLKQAFKTKECKVSSTKKVIEIRIPSMDFAARDEEQQPRNRMKLKPQFLYRHKNI